MKIVKKPIFIHFNEIKYGIHIYTGALCCSSWNSIPWPDLKSTCSIRSTKVLLCLCKKKHYNSISSLTNAQLKVFVALSILRFKQKQKQKHKQKHQHLITTFVIRLKRENGFFQFKKWFPVTNFTDTKLILSKRFINVVSFSLKIYFNLSRVELRCVHF